MARQSRFIPKQTPRGWCLNVPAKFAASKKRERQYFKSRALAEAAAKALKERKEAFGAESQIISPTLAMQATEAAALLDQHGASILDAARFYVAHQTRLQASVMLGEALSQFRQRKEDRSETQVRNYRLMAEQMIEDLPARNLAEITGEEIEVHIRKRTGGPASFNQRLRLIRAFWTWASKKPRRWCDPDELDHIEREETTSGHIETLTAEECRNLLQTAENHHPDAVIGFALMLFTGMRRQEVERLQPEDFKPDGIEVPATSAKTKRRRFIQMPEPLKAWMKEYPLAETVLPSNWRRKHREIRRLAGWRVWSDLSVPSRPPAELPEWPDNALRHTAATVALALGKPIETLVFEHGHSGGLNVLRNHYIGQMTKKEAEAILALRPKKKGRAE